MKLDVTQKTIQSLQLELHEIRNLLLSGEPDVLNKATQFLVGFMQKAKPFLASVMQANQAATKQPLKHLQADISNTVQLITLIKKIDGANPSTTSVIKPLLDHMDSHQDAFFKDSPTQLTEGYVHLAYLQLKKSDNSPQRLSTLLKIMQSNEGAAYIIQYDYVNDVTQIINDNASKLSQDSIDEFKEAFLNTKICTEYFKKHPIQKSKIQKMQVKLADIKTEATVDLNSESKLQDLLHKSQQGHMVLGDYFELLANKDFKKECDNNLALQNFTKSLYPLLISNTSQAVFNTFSNLTQAIKPSDYKNPKNWSATRGLPHLKAVAQNFNGISYQMRDAVLNQSSLEGRVNMAMACIDLANTQPTNFMMIFATAGALGSSTITRIREIQENLPEAYQQKLQDLSELLSPAANFKNLRAADVEARQSGQPYIPPLNTYFTDATFIVEGNEGKPDADIHINKLLNDSLGHMTDVSKQLATISKQGPQQVVKPDVLMDDKQAYERSKLIFDKNKEVLDEVSAHRDTLIGKTLSLTSAQEAKNLVELLKTGQRIKFRKNNFIACNALFDEKKPTQFIKKDSVTVRHLFLKLINSKLRPGTASQLLNELSQSPWLNAICNQDDSLATIRSSVYDTLSQPDFSFEIVDSIKLASLNAILKSQFEKYSVSIPRKSATMKALVATLNNPDSAMLNAGNPDALNSQLQTVFKLPGISAADFKLVTKEVSEVYAAKKLLANINDLSRQHDGIKTAINQIETLKNNATDGSDMSALNAIEAKVNTLKSQYQSLCSYFKNVSAGTINRLPELNPQFKVSDEFTQLKDLRSKIDSAEYEKSIEHSTGWVKNARTELVNTALASLFPESAPKPTRQRSRSLTQRIRDRFSRKPIVDQTLQKAQSFQDKKSQLTTIDNKLQHIIFCLKHYEPGKVEDAAFEKILMHTKLRELQKSLITEKKSLNESMAVKPAEPRRPRSASSPVKPPRSLTEAPSNSMSADIDASIHFKVPTLESFKAFAQEFKDKGLDVKYSADTQTLQYTANNTSNIDEGPRQALENEFIEEAIKTLAKQRMIGEEWGKPIEIGGTDSRLVNRARIVCSALNINCTAKHGTEFQPLTDQQQQSVETLKTEFEHNGELRLIQKDFEDHRLTATPLKNV